MQMKAIVCEVHPFNLNQSVFMINDTIITPLGLTSLKDLGHTLVHDCYHNQVYDIHLVGPTSFLTKIIKDIEMYEVDHYSANKIKVEVN